MRSRAWSDYIFVHLGWYTQAYSLWGKEDYLLITRYVRVFQHIAYSIQLDFLPSKGALSSNDIVGLIYRRNYSRKDYLFTLWPLKVLPMRLVLDWVGSRLWRWLRHATLAKPKWRGVATATAWVAALFGRFCVRYALAFFACFFYI